MKKGSIKAILVTILAISLMLPFSIVSFADDITNFGDVNISGGNNTVSTATGNITMDSGTIQIGSTNDSQQIVQNTATTNTKLDSVISSLTNINNSLATLFGRITSPICILYDSICNPVIQTTSSRSFTVNGQSYTYTLLTHNIGGGNTYYLNFAGLIRLFYTEFVFNVTQTTGNAWNQGDSNMSVVTFYGYPCRIQRRGFYVYSYDSSTDVISRNQVYLLCNFTGWIYNIIHNNWSTYTLANIQYLADTWYRWYDPNISLADSKFWKAYNTDTGQYDDVNFSTVFAYITWYLGQIYDDQTNITQNIEDLQDQVDTAVTTFQDLNNKEQVAIDQINQGFQTFLPDSNIFGSFQAITWCSNYLQQVYLALGSYGTVIFIALLFGVCLQFIGYFRYK